MSFLVSGLLPFLLLLLAATLDSSHALLGKANSAAEARQKSLELEWSKDLEEPEAEPESQKKKYVSPVKRVANLLVKMKAELEAEAIKESEMYDKMVCWCETTSKEKNAAVASADALDLDLSAEIEGRAGRFGELETSIAQMKEDIQANQQSLDTATAIREKEAAQFSDEENDLMQYITNLKNAIAVLSKHQGSSMLQMDPSTLSGMRVLLRDLATKAELVRAGRAEQQQQQGASSRVSLLSLAATAGSDNDKQSDALLEALQVKSGHVSDALPLKFAAEVVARAAGSTPSAFLQKQPIYSSRSSHRSAQIFGVLQQMKEEFEADLSEAQKAEMQAKEAYKELHAAKTAELDAGKKKLDETELEHASNQKALSDAKENLATTREQRSEDVEFLTNLKLTCNDLDAQWEKRSKTRSLETKAVAEAIVILTEDDNREHLAKTVTLLQLDSDASLQERVRRNSAAGFLRQAAGGPDFEADDLLAAWNGREAPKGMLGAAGGPRTQLSTLATAVQLDSFKKVKEMMDKMIADLKDQQSEEVTFKDHCTAELDTTEKTLYNKGQLKKDLEATISHLEMMVDKLEGEIKDHQGQISATQVEIKKAGEQREAENKDFQVVVADQRATQSILAKAMTKLKDFYEKTAKESFLQQGSNKKQTPPVQFNDYKVNAGSNSVIGLLEQIIEDSKALEAEATASETSAQAAYETFVKDSNGVIAVLQQAITKKSEDIAAAKSDLAVTSEDLDNTVGELESLTAYEEDLHYRCDFVLKNFDIRQHARLQEIEAIQQAKAILSGMQ
mmetsp:Transcript_95763/g.209447  ORF Transcript_95763/g.209447 Transcript_95763/m.209447 type:complete len:791 (+) Transcript_95763:1039-3411(+)